MPLSRLPDWPDSKQPVLIHQDQSLTAADVEQRLSAERRALAPLAGCRVAIGGADPVGLLLQLLASDGLLAAVYLLPETLWQQKVGQQLLKSGLVDALLDDRSTGEPNQTGRVDVQTPTETTYYLPTSGTTGEPRWHAHSRQSLNRNLRQASPDHSAWRWALLYDPCRFAGLQVVLQAIAGGGSMLLCQTEAADEQLRQIRQHGVDALSATPTWWRRALMLGGLKGHALRRITLGGEATDQALLDALAHQFPDARIRHIYASTEAGVGFCVRDGRAGFPAEWLRSAPDQLALDISEQGTLMLKPPGTEAFIDSGDLVQQDGDRLYFLGRASGVINVAGHKVIPEAVERLIRRQPGVAEARVYGQRSSLAGQLVVAEVVPAPGQDQQALHQSIQQACQQSLAREQRPAMIRMVQQLATNASGKLERNR